VRRLGKSQVLEVQRPRRWRLDRRLLPDPDRAALPVLVQCVFRDEDLASAEPVPLVPDQAALAQPVDERGRDAELRCGFAYSE
jgi:hypothetical protein